ncbi:MAG: hypothetical protein KDB14_30190 [Planctomycetales bacterium]|nr:hypothetical protein [Planctomycetales bacterium]
MLQTIPAPSGARTAAALLALLAFVAQAGGEEPAQRIALAPGVTLRAATVEEGQKILLETDRFTSQLSAFDLDSRVGRTSATRADFDKLVSAQVLPWENDELDKIRAAAAVVTDWMRQRELQPPFPREILLIQTTGKDEGNAAYCRGRAIILPQRVVRDSRPNRMNDLLAHELFHIVSANHPELQRALYAAIGFRPCPPIQLPADLAARKITNPDGPGLDYYIQLQLEQDPATEARLVKAVPLLFAKSAFDPERGGSFFDYMQFQLLVVAAGEDGVWRAGSGKTGSAPQLIEPRSAPDFFRQIGRNTSYIVHPDEVLADNFVFLLQGKKDLKSPHVVEQMEKIIKTHAPKASTQK